MTSCRAKVVRPLFSNTNHRKLVRETLSCVILPHRQIKYPVDFDDELKIGDVRYDNMT